jgi:hypothetical protein
MDGTKERSVSISALLIVNGEIGGHNTCFKGALGSPIKKVLCPPISRNRQNAPGTCHRLGGIPAVSGRRSYGKASTSNTDGTTRGRRILCNDRREAYRPGPEQGTTGEAWKAPSVTNCIMSPEFRDTESTEKKRRERTYPQMTQMTQSG